MWKDVTFCCSLRSKANNSIFKMKRFIAVLTVLLVTYVYAGNAPEIIQKEFDQRFPGATDVSWERENPKGWIAEFVWQDRNVIANYNFAGNWLETKTQIPTSELPKPVLETIESFYPDWKIVVAHHLQNAKNEIRFKVALQQDSKLQEIVLKEEGTLLMVGIE